MNLKFRSSVRGKMILTGVALLSISAVFAAAQPLSQTVASANTSYEQKNWSVYTASAQEIVRMQESGVAAGVIRTYILNSNVPFKPTVDDILYLHKHQVPDDLVSDWIKKGSELTVAAQPTQPASSPDLVAANTQPQQPQPAPAATPAPAQQQAPVVVTQQQPTVVYQQAPPTVVYQSPTYVYTEPYYYTPPVSIGFSYGWGRPYWGHSHFYAPVHHGYYHGGWGSGVRVGVGFRFGGHHH